MDNKELKSRFDIADYAENHYGIVWNDKGLACCPFPEKHMNGDRDPSCQVSRDFQTVKCWSQGCFGEKGVDIIGLVQKMEKMSFREAKQKLEQEVGPDTTPPKSRAAVVTATFDYKDEESVLLYQIQRKEPGKGGRAKDFIFRRPNGEGGWVYKNGGTRLVPYRLPDFANEDAVVIVEGEKCVDALFDLGIPATTNPFGAGKWRDDFGTHFEGKRVVIWPDKDDAGQCHARALCSLLRKCAREILIVSPPDSLPEKGDVADGIEAGWSKDDVQSILDKAELPTATEPVFALPTAFTQTDDGNAERLSRRHGQQLRYCYEKGWLVWTGTHWAVDRRGELQRLAVETIKVILAEELPNIDSLEESKNLWSWAKSSLNNTRIRSMISCAEAKDPIPAVLEDFDRDPLKLNLLNGTLDLKTTLFGDHNREDLITKVARVHYDPEAQCPMWLAFLDRVLNRDGDLIQYVQKAVGYSLTGSTDEECVFILYGVGANGKSTFVETIAAMLGDYAMQTPTETLMMRRSDAPTNDLARLQGARFVSAAETEEDRRLAESKVKAMTGGDTVTARFLFKEFFDFRPEFKIYLSCNHRPLVRGTDDAIWRRLRLIPFLVQIPPLERDPSLKGPRGKLQTELSGILNWALEGCKLWQKDGLISPHAVREATGGYRSDMDVLGSYIADRCLEGDSFTARTGLLYADYTSWCEESGEQPWSQKALGQKLGERGFEPGKDNKGRLWRGIGLKSEMSS
jgi:putative DNA primase/helicase